ncbi:hypothetical protein DOE78_16365 [Bacillus sp. Y1]|nr:hypothetical protein [Bacillus sp. Y1]AYA78572.1 hypothetical protein DOE78_16365 [Bacillus sp. Y1]
MLIKSCVGYELEKEKSNTSEDFFNRSEVTFVEENTEKTLAVLYVRYFEEKLNEFTPFLENPIFQEDGLEVHLMDIVALVLLIKNPGFRHRKRVYINNQNEFAAYFQDIDLDKIIEVVKKVKSNQACKLPSLLEFTVQA